MGKKAYTVESIELEGYLDASRYPSSSIDSTVYAFFPIMFLSNFFISFYHVDRG